MSIARRHTFRLLIALSGLAFVVMLIDRAGTASARGVPGVLRAGPSAWSAVLAGLAAALIAFIACLTRRQVQRIRSGLSAARLFRTTGPLGPEGGRRAIAVVEVTGAERLSAARRRGVMKSLQLYLEGFVEPGERFARVGMNSYGLLLAAGDDAALSRRLAILEQDAGFLFMAAYPAQGPAARVASLPLQGDQRPEEALRCLLARLASDPLQSRRP